MKSARFELGKTENRSIDPSETKKNFEKLNLKNPKGELQRQAADVPRDGAKVPRLKLGTKVLQFLRSPSFEFIVVSGDFV